MNASESSGPRIGVQLNPGFGSRVGDDLPGVLADVRQAGFDGVEAGLLFDGDPQAAGGILSGHGLVQWSLHTGYRPGYEVAREVEYLSELGGKFIVLSGVGSHEEESGIRPFEEAADALNQAGELCRDAGLTFCYHNHGWEFREIGGVSGLDRLMELTDPALVRICVDVFWAQYGGRDPLELIQRYIDRLAFVHMKDLKYTGPEPRPAGVLSPLFPRLPLNGQAEYVELGLGEVDLPGVWDLIAPTNPEWLVYEQDESTLPPEQAAAISRRYLKERFGI
ncbi:MAG: sugar phosphate isomerase/epimerase [Dehalococcoidia bacterium]|jgi:sugar phosphate isomerase/epimerase|nr:sugar phosphate isomerase/epimerase [Dehalococcoidia bacterium]